MKRIILFCAAGMSTSLLVNKMKEAAKSDSFEAYIEAFSVNEIDKKGHDADCILLGPQVRYQLKKTEEKYPDKPVAVIDMLAYGTMDGRRVLDQAKAAMGL